MLGHKVVPDCFWEKVDALTSYAAIVFQDIFNLANVADDGQNLHVPAQLQKFRQTRDNNICFMYSELHFILAHAAYFHVSMRRSSSIFHYLSATPGARMDYSIEGQACYELYRLSKEEYERRETAKSQEDKKVIEECESTQGHTAEELTILKREKRIDAHHRLRGAKIKFAVWPMITRYRAENVGRPVVRPHDRSRFNEDGAGCHNGWPTRNEVEAGEGQSIVEIGKCVVVYYQGIIYPRPAQTGQAVESDGRSLLAYLESEKASQDHAIWKRIALRRFALRLIAAVIMLSVTLSRTWLQFYFGFVPLLLVFLLSLGNSYRPSQRPIRDITITVGRLIVLGVFILGKPWGVIDFKGSSLPEWLQSELSISPPFPIFLIATAASTAGIAVPKLKSGAQVIFWGVTFAALLKSLSAMFGIASPYAMTILQHLAKWTAAWKAQLNET